MWVLDKYFVITVTKIRFIIDIVNDTTVFANAKYLISREFALESGI